MKTIGISVQTAIRLFGGRGSAVRRFVPGAALALALFLSGCQSYEIVQTNMFSDEDGRIVQIDYGRSDTDHVNTFIAPTTGKEMDYRSKLVVVVTLPDDTSFKAWQCMNFLPSGTMYRTDNEKWMTHVNGFVCSVYRRTDETPPRYREVYRGVMCDVAEREKTEKDARWRTLAPTEKGWQSNKWSKKDEDE